MRQLDIAELVLAGVQELKAAGMGDRAIARAVGLSHVTILKWSAGETSPTAKNAQKFLDRLPKLLGVAKMTKIFVAEADAGVSALDVEAHADALLSALKVLKRGDARSKKLLDEIRFLLEEDAPSRKESARGPEIKT